MTYSHATRREPTLNTVGQRSQAGYESGCGTVDPSGVGRLRGVDILLVEDDALSREALELIFSYYGATVHCTDSVEEALRAYDRRPPSIVVSDIGLPGQDGCALIRALRLRERTSGRHLPAIALSGFPGPETSQRARQAGFDAFLRKPVEIHVLLQLVSDMVCRN